MTNLERSLIVEHIVARATNLIVIDCRCAEGTIPIGTLFRTVYRHLRPRSNADYLKSWDRHSVRHVSLRLEKIVAYSHDLPEMDPGLTGRASFVGIGAELIRDGDILVDDERTY